MSFKDLTERLQNLGEETPIPSSTVRKWVQEGLVTPPTRRHRRKGEGSGTVSEWSKKSLEDIAGCLNVKRYGSGRRDLFKSIKIAKGLADFFYTDPIGWELRQPSLYKKFYVKDDFNESEKINSRVVYGLDTIDFFQWVAAIEKVRHGWRLSDHGYCDFIFTYSGDLFDKTLRYCFYVSRFISSEEAKRSEVRIVIYEHEAFQNALTAKKKAQMAANVGTPPSEKEGEKGVYFVKS